MLMCRPGWTANPDLLMATTTSTDNTGLLDYLAPHFTAATGIDIRWTATGTGKALELGKRCDVDVLLVHAPDAEKQYVADGWGINRQPIMYNDFVVIGPKSDPADIRKKTTKGALKAIAASGARFVSRGDDSGTHKKEIALWQAAGLTRPDKASWYIQTGQGMLSSINIAAEQSGYILTDRGTYIKYAHDKGGSPPLVIVVEGGDMLRNQYSVIQVSPENCPDVKADQARAFSQWMAGKQAQKLIEQFRLLDKQLFIPNADQ
ncbi:MAG: substrate-binding domain-containing protein [Desulfobacterales bacterium]|nr:substrate-binding domain-containing protein [Desulfobacterales bacterium]